MNIFDISLEYLKIAEEMAEVFQSGSDELPEELMDRLIINQDQFAGKAESYVHMITQWQVASDTIDAEIKRLQARKKGFEKAQERLKSLMLEALQFFGEPTKAGGFRFKSPTVGLARVPTKAVEVSDVESLPADLVQHTFTVKESGFLAEFVKQQLAAAAVAFTETKAPVKAAIKEKIEAGIEVPGASIKEGAYLKIS